ncbi:uncharacterized protein LOC135813962 [Sycon ciliatum]|uniref:uncharacterized protein LOC135813962 n=1 Tax=Sycon ciliatum TaxID=27933 RepID=UPI0020AA8629|eukprot:scpid83943/ scgid27683/ 
MSASLVQLLTSRSALCTLGQSTPRVQPVAALGHSLVGQVRHKPHKVMIHGTKKTAPVRGMRARLFKAKLPMRTELHQVLDVIKPLKNLHPDELAKLKDENRFLPRSAEAAIPLKPLEEGEVGLTEPAARADFLIDHTLINQRLRKPHILKDSPTLAKFSGLRVRATGSDKIVLETFIKDVRRFATIIGVPRQGMLGLPDQEKEVRVLKTRISGKRETRVVAYNLDVFTRTIQLPSFPGFYTDILTMMLMKYAPAGIDIVIEVKSTGAVGAAFATKDMRSTAAKMAKKAMKGSGKMRVM